MDLSLSTGALKNLFSFPFHDPNWKMKFLTGGAVLLVAVIPVIPWVIMLGYIARIIRTSARFEDASRLPEWDHWTEMLWDGLRLWGVAIVFSLPLFVIMATTWSLLMISFEQIIESLILQAVVFLLFVSSFGIIICTSIFVPVVQAHVAVERRFRAAFEIQDWWKIFRSNMMGFLLAAGIFIILQTVMIYILQFLIITVLFCVAAPIFFVIAYFYRMLLVHRLIGLAYGEGREKANPSPAPTQVAV